MTLVFTSKSELKPLGGSEVHLVPAGSSGKSLCGRRREGVGSVRPVRPPGRVFPSAHQVEEVGLGAGRPGLCVSGWGPVRPDAPPANFQNQPSLLMLPPGWHLRCVWLAFGCCPALSRRGWWRGAWAGAGGLRGPQIFSLLLLSGAPGSGLVWDQGA